MSANLHDPRSPYRRGPATSRRPGPAAWLARPLTWASGVCMGLMAGLFFAFAVSVMPGLARTDDATFVASMRSMNRAIENLPFAVVFGGSFVFTATAAVVHLRLGRRRTAGWLLGALALYVVALIITMGVNIPLNDTLETVRDSASAAALATARADFEGPWNTSHDIRTIATVLAFCCLVTAAGQREGKTA